VADAASGLGIPVLTPTSLKDVAAHSDFAVHDADVAVVVAYGLLLPEAILAVPRHGCLNLHASLLPRWRGAAPIQRAIMAGDSETGIAIMRMERGLDTGPVGLEERISIGPAMTASDLHDLLARRGADAMVRAVGALERGQLDFTPQPEEGVTYARKIEKAESRIDWTRPAAELHNHVRGLSPFPGAWCMFGGGERLKVLRAATADETGEAGLLLNDGLTVACGDGALRLLDVQRAGGKPMAGDAFLRGTGLRAGDRLD
ncbi:MAG: methionyl-tRNA formyltransferase, partial [Pseudomonadota bacterium]